jgi:hypothetical protein
MGWVQYQVYDGLTVNQINMAAIKRTFIDNWIAQRVTSLLGYEDEVVIGLTVNSLDQEVRCLMKLCVCLFILAFCCCSHGFCSKFSPLASASIWRHSLTAVFVLYSPRFQKLDPRELVLNLTGFLAKDALGLVSELWRLLVEAQNSPDGIPDQFKQAVQHKLTQHLVCDCFVV